VTRNQAKGRTQACGATEARSRLRQARRFIEVAELAGDESAPDPDFTSAAAALTVLAGIAAADAACCKALGMRSRSDNHHDAEGLLRQIDPGGREAALALRKLISQKDDAHYGFYDVTASNLKKLHRQARHLIAFANDVLTR
jgi:hypothetical protein